MIVCAIGYRPDLSWIDAPIFNDRGNTPHERGVTCALGLYSPVLHRRYTRGPSLIGWASQDAQFLVEQILQSEA